MTRSVTGRAIWGMVLILLGLLFLLDQLEVAATGDTIGTWWPLILIGLGGWGLVTSTGRNLGALVLLLVGVALQIDELELVEGSVWDYAWPVALIVLGLWLLFRRPWSGAPFGGDTAETAADDHLDLVAIMGGHNRRVVSEAWRGGEVTAIMGGAELYLDDVALAESGARLELTAIMGGIEVFVPAGWDVDLRGTPFLGGIEDKRRRTSPPEDVSRPRLRVDATAIMGGIELKDA